MARRFPVADGPADGAAQHDHYLYGLPKKTMILLDTGYFIALFTPDDDLHARAVAWSAQLNEPMLVTEYVLLECVNAFSRPKDRPSAHALIEHVHSDAACELVHASLNCLKPACGCIASGWTRNGH